MRPCAKPVEIASVNRSTSASRYAFATSVARKSRADVGRSRNGFVNRRVHPLIRTKREH